MNATEPVRRTTRQRTAVLAVLDDLDSFRSAQQIHAELARRGDAVGLSTVYRCLTALASERPVWRPLRCSSNHCRRVDS